MLQEASPLPQNVNATVRTTTKKSNQTVFILGVKTTYLLKWNLMILGKVKR